jgi:oxygen-independent coproporphyrinogen-3 oxidase
MITTDLNLGFDDPGDWHPEQSVTPVQTKTISSKGTVPALISSTLRDACIADAERDLKEAYRHLPSDYFDHRTPDKYLFNNIERCVQQYPETQSDEERSELIAHELAQCTTAMVYFGVPWCEQICAFCNFASSISQNSEVHERYCLNLARELDLLQVMGLRDKKVTLAYFGGGTPTVISDDLFQYYLSTTLRALDLTETASVTCEGTVTTLTDRKLAAMRNAGVTRLSTGVQSLDEKVRSVARLRGSPIEALEAVERCRSWFEMVNIDLIYGHPYQDVAAWYATVLQIASLQVPSLTLYRLEVKPRTMIFKQFQQSSEPFCSELEARLQYFVARIILEDHGYVETPLGWWIKRERLTSAVSWQTHMKGWASSSPYFGFGQGAFTMGRTYYAQNHDSLTAWEQSISRMQLPYRSVRALNQKVPFLNVLFRTLRTTCEINLEAISEELEQISLIVPLRRMLDQCTKWGLFERSENRYTLTLAGRSTIHWIIADLVSELGSPTY